MVVKTVIYVADLRQIKNAIYVKEYLPIQRFGDRLLRMILFIFEIYILFTH